MKTTVRFILILLAVLVLSGCSAQEQPLNSGDDLSDQSTSGTMQETTAESSQSGEEPLAFSDQQEQTQDQGSVMYLSMNGETLKMELVGLVQNGGSYSVMYWARDVRNNLLGSVSLSIPVRGQPGDQFRETDEYTGLSMANVTYTDRNGNTYSTYSDSSSNYETYEEFLNPSAPTYREGRQFVIAIDDVSADGNVISGRLIAKFNGRDDDSSDNTVVTIDESSFVFDMRDAS